MNRRDFLKLFSAAIAAASRITRIIPPPAETTTLTITDAAVFEAGAYIGIDYGYADREILSVIAVDPITNQITVQRVEPTIIEQGVINYYAEKETTEETEQ